MNVNILPENLKPIVFQENNAVITLDLQTETITGLYPLYKKSWSTDCSMDASNRDDGTDKFLLCTSRK